MKFGSPAPVPMNTASKPSASRSSTVSSLPMTEFSSISAPSFFSASTSACTIALGSRNSGMP